MMIRKVLALALVAVVAQACGSCGGNNANNNNGTNNTTGGSNNVDAYEQTDSVSTLPDGARRAICEGVIATAGEPGETVDCGEGVEVTLPAVSDCAEDLSQQPECVTVEAYENCNERLLACDFDALEDAECYFATAETCEPVDDTGAVTDLSDEQKRELCRELVSENLGPDDIECSATEVRHIPSFDECVTQLDTFQPCATVEALRDCFTDFAQCDAVDRDACWFFIGDDGGCSAPYLGQDRVPVALSVLPPVPVDCAAPDARQRIPFSIATTDVFPLVPGDIVNGLAVQPGITFDSGSFTVRRPRISKLAEAACTTDAECGAGFKCATAGLPGAPRQCTRQSPISFVPATMQLDYDPGTSEQNKQLVGVLIENTALLDGRLPTASGSLFDENGEKDLFSDPARASDPTRIHREAIKNFLINVASVADPLNTAVTIYWHAGQVSAEARPLINEPQLEDHFSNDLSIGDALIDAMPAPVPKPANTFQAMRAMVKKDFGLDKYTDHEKFLFVFTDGANEVWDGVEDADGPDTLEQTIEDLQSTGVHTFIVHLDAGVDPSLIRDVPTYWAGNTNCQDDPNCMGAPPCGSDAQCRNFETCRPVTIYGETAQDGVQQSAASYCMPNYNDEGRLGPIDYWADIACQTGGNYMYVTRPEQMRFYWNALANSINGQYSIEADFAALQSGDFPDGWYRLAGVFLGIIGLRDLGIELTAPVDATDQDNRSILRMGN